MHGRLRAYAALLTIDVYRFDEHRLRARSSRQLGKALGYHSLAAARKARGSNADVRASLLLDGWFVALEDDDLLEGSL